MYTVLSLYPFNQMILQVPIETNVLIVLFHKTDRLVFTTITFRSVSLSGKKSVSPGPADRLFKKCILSPSKD